MYDFSMEISAKVCTEQISFIKPVVKELRDGVWGVYSDVSEDDFLNENAAVRYDFKTNFEDYKFTAVYRHSEFWCRPSFGDDFTFVPDETQTLIVKLCDEQYLVVYPVVNEVYRTVLCQGEQKGVFGARVFSQVSTLKECRGLNVVYKFGSDPYSLVHDCIEAALQELGNNVLMRKDRVYPELFEYLGWCSWDALQIRVSESGLLEKCKEFKEKNIPVRWAIIDDMWGDVPEFTKEKYSSREEMFALMHSSTLASFEAAPTRFPKGLAHTISQMKKYLTWVGMWHPTTGYWFGIQPESELFKRFESDLYCTADGRYIPKPEFEAFYNFFDSWHSFFEECGADFVKIDNQSIARRFYKNTHPIGQVARNMHKAIEKSTVSHFDNRLINCMGCASENIQNRPSSPISRCSDDFIPNDRDWFTKHILQCSYACFMQGEIINCDWDMWWSGDGQGIKNSVIRAISGGPIYVSDEIGESVREVLMPLADSEGRIYRCDKPALPSLDCLVKNPEDGGVFKIQNTAKGSGVIAAFNINSSEKSVCGSISPDDVYGLCGEEFAVYEHFTKQCFVLKRGEKMNVTLETRDDFRLYNFVEIKEGFAVLGDTSKFICPLTVKKADKGGVELTEGNTCLVYKDGKFENIEV